MSNWLPGSSSASMPARLLFLLILTLMPLWIGATGSLARFVLFVGCFVLLFLVLIRSKVIYRPPGLVPFFLFCCFLLLQCVPLPPTVLELVIPGYVPQLQSGLWLISPGVWHPLSLYPAATFSEFLRYSAYLAFYLAATNLLISSSGQKRLLLWLSGFVGLYSFLGLVQFFAPTERIFWFFAKRPDSGRLFATYVNSNHYAALVGMVFPLIVICLLLNVPHVGYGSLRDRIADIFTDSELNRAILLALVAIVAAVSVFFSLSRSGTTCLFISSVILLALLFGREHLRGRMLIFITVLVSAVGLLAFFGWDPLLERFARTFNAEGELQTQRLTYWVDSLNLLRAAPLMGSGAGTFIDSYPAWQTAITRDLVVDHAHNDYVEMLTDLGVLGFSLVLWFWCAFLQTVIPAWRQRRSKSARLISAGAFAGLCSIMLHSFTDFNLAIPANGLYLFLLFALMAGATHSTSQRQSEGSLLTVCSNGLRKSLILGGVSFSILGCMYLAGGEFARYYFAPVASKNMVQATSVELHEIREASDLLTRFAPLVPVYPFAAGMVFGTQGDLLQSQKRYKKAIWQRPLHVEYQQQEARNLFALNKKNEAESVLKNTLILNPWKWGSYRELAQYYFATKREPEGFDILKRGLERNPDKTSVALSLLVVSGVERSHFFEIIPDRSRSWAVLGDFYLKLKKTENAGRAYRRGVDVLMTEDSPDTFLLWRYLQMLRNEKRNAEALALLQTGLNLFPENAAFLSTQGALYEKEGLRDRAIDAYRASILSNSRQDWVRKRLKALDPANKQ